MKILTIAEVAARLGKSKLDKPDAAKERASGRRYHGVRLPQGVCGEADSGWGVNRGCSRAAWQYDYGGSAGLRGFDRTERETEGGGEEGLVQLNGACMLR